MSTYLCIFIDTTGSMGSWIATLNKMIPQFIRISGLTGAFEKICVVEYKDYDVPVNSVVSSTGWCDPTDPLLINFSKGLRAAGGGGTPEAVKTGLYKVLNELPSNLNYQTDRVYLLHLTDAPAHEGSSESLDDQGTKELKALGPERFDWVELTTQVLLRPIVYSCFSTCNFNLYSSLASATGGFYIKANVNQLEDGILGIFNGWFGTDPDLVFNSKELELKARCKNIINGESDIIKCYKLVDIPKSITQPELANALGSVLIRLDTDQSYRSKVFVLLESIIKDDVLTLASNKIFGRLWRKVCCFRRIQAILAMLALGTVLDTQAKEFLTKYKGTWLNWSLDSDSKPEIPENFQVKFLYLCKNAGLNYFTQEEMDKINRLTSLTLCNRIPDMNVEVLTQVLSGMDGIRPDHHQICLKCAESRPISLMRPELTCGYCYYEDKPKINPTSESTFMVRCTGCEAFYSRDKGQHIMGKSLCHECANGLEPINCICKTCGYKFVCRSSQGLPGGICKPCELGMGKLNPVYKTHRLTVRELLSDTPSGLKLLNSLIGFSWVKDVNNLIQMDQVLTTVDKPDLDQVKSMSIIWSNKLITNWDQIVDQLNQTIQSHYIERLTCDLCCEPKPNSELGSACGRSGCDQLLCDTCGSNWYGTNKLGHVINLRHCGCMFCSRTPGPKVVRRWWNPDAMALARPGPIPPMDPEYYYAWCVRCRQIKPCGHRACGGAQAPRFENFECEECETTRAAFEEEQKTRDINSNQEIKSCPNCTIPTIRYAGCNHITCTCGTHWCYECGGAFEYDHIYTHMNRVHGRIYSNETPEFDEYYSDDEY